MSIRSLTLELTSLAETDRLGSLLAELLPPGMTVALNGTLGAGKTRLVEAIAAALGLPRDDVVSPTFVLCQQYEGQLGEAPRTLYHFDAYRLRDLDEFLELGIEEYFDSEGITLIEWADRVSECLPRDHLTIELTVRGEAQREASLTASGRCAGEVIERLADRYGVAY
jgi:tRNA threonylcarbamoyladenosine biosynthesis protein TsaE